MCTNGAFSEVLESVSEQGQIKLMCTNGAFSEVLESVSEQGQIKLMCTKLNSLMYYFVKSCRFLAGVLETEWNTLIYFK